MVEKLRILGGCHSGSHQGAVVGVGPDRVVFSVFSMAHGSATLLTPESGEPQSNSSTQAQPRGSVDVIPCCLLLRAVRLAVQPTNHGPHGSVVERVTSNDKVVSSILAVGSHLIFCFFGPFTPWNPSTLLPFCMKHQSFPMVPYSFCPAERCKSKRNGVISRILCPHKQTSI